MTLQSWGPGVLHLHFVHRTISVPVTKFEWKPTHTGVGDLSWEETDRVAFYFDPESLLMWVFEPEPPQVPEGAVGEYPPVGIEAP